MIPYISKIIYNSSNSPEFILSGLYNFIQTINTYSTNQETYVNRGSEKLTEYDTYYKDYLQTKEDKDKTKAIIFTMNSENDHRRFSNVLLYDDIEMV